MLANWLIMRCLSSRNRGLVTFCVTCVHSYCNPLLYSKFYQVLKERVDNYFKEHNIVSSLPHCRATLYAVLCTGPQNRLLDVCSIHAILCDSQFLLGQLSEQQMRQSVALIPVNYLYQILVWESWVLLLLAAIGWGVFTALVAMTCTHDARQEVFGQVYPYTHTHTQTRSHFAVTHKPWVWKLVGSVHDIYQGASILAWMYQHTFGHHPYTNIDGADPDIVTASPVRCHAWLLIIIIVFKFVVSGLYVCLCRTLIMYDAPMQEVPDIRRIKWKQKWLPRYFYQHVFVPMLYCLVSVLSITIHE